MASGPGYLTTELNLDKNITSDQSAHENSDPPFSFSISFVTRVVNGAILREAGKRIWESIFLAEVLSDDFCSNRYQNILGSYDVAEQT